MLNVSQNWESGRDLRSQGSWRGGADQLPTFLSICQQIWRHQLHKSSPINIPSTSPLQISAQSVSKNLQHLSLESLILWQCRVLNIVTLFSSGVPPKIKFILTQLSVIPYLKLGQVKIFMFNSFTTLLVSNEQASAYKLDTKYKDQSLAKRDLNYF